MKVENVVADMKEGKLDRTGDREELELQLELIIQFVKKAFKIIDNSIWV